MAVIETSPDDLAAPHSLLPRLRAVLYCADSPSASESTELVESAKQLAAAIAERPEPQAFEHLHDALYALASQDNFSPADAPRINQYDLGVVTALNELEGAFERNLGEVSFPTDPPSGTDEFLAWLRDLTLSSHPFGDVGLSEYLEKRATLDEMKEIVAQRSLFFLKEPDPWAMVIPTLRGEAKAGLLDLLLDEYGWGRLEHMHSSVYEQLMVALDLDTEYDAYASRAPWQFLATYNYQSMTARRTRLSRRMLGYIYLTEATAPDAMRTYLTAYARLGIEDKQVLHFYELHEAADEGHQGVALDEVIKPVVRDEPGAALEVARGVLEGMWLEHQLSEHLFESFASDKSSLR